MADKRQLVETVLHTSTGEVIDTQRLDDIEPAKSTEEPIDIPVDDDNVHSLEDAKQTSREVAKALRQAKRKYGGRKYNRLDPKNYTDEQIAKDKETRRRRRISIIAISLVVALMVCVGIGYAIYNIVNPALTFSHNVCSNDEVVRMIEQYKAGNVTDITTYIDSKISDPNYTNDAKCVYVGALEFSMKGVKSGVEAYINIFDSLADSNEVKELIRREHAPTMSELSSNIQQQIDNPADPNDGRDGTMESETIVIDDSQTGEI